MKVITALSEFFSACYTETGHVPIGMVLPDALYDRLATEMGPRLVVVAKDNEGGEEMRIETDVGPAFIRRAPVTRFTLTL